MKKLTIILCAIFFLTPNVNTFASPPDKFSASGTASWYSYESCRKEGTSGRITASGKAFNEHNYTCAMWDIAFGTKLKVTNLKTGATIEVTVTDRGPAKRLVRKGRIIDLSKAAFAKIADLRAGVIKVKVEAL